MARRARIAEGLTSLPSIQLIAELLALGAFAGLLAGLLGVGGGMLMVPFVTLLISARGVESAHAVKMAIATSMSTILFTSVSSLRAHHKRGAVRWDLFGGIAPGIVIGGLLAGAGAFAIIKGALLAVLFALFVGFSATQLLLDRKPAATRSMPGRLGQSAAGAAIGFLSGLVGAGGAFLLVPVLIAILRVPVRVSIGTSLAMITASALTGFLGKAITGQIPLGPALAVIAGSLTGAPLGAKVSHRAPITVLRVVLGAIIAVVSIRVWADVLWH